MPVGHERINDPNEHPNPDVTFIRVLDGFPQQKKALKILNSLAAQFRPITKKHGFGINALNEYEYNTEFAGRNWNAGEIVEIVLRKKDGSFHSYSWLIYVMCHELAHIHHMNHAHEFKALDLKLRQEVTFLRLNKYFGDGFWSAGHSLVHESMEDGHRGFDEDGDEHRWLCGGAYKKRGAQKRKTKEDDGKPAKAKRRAPAKAVKLGSTGRQTAIAPKAGGRVMKKDAFLGAGNVMNADDSSKRRQTQSNAAVDLRVAAAEARAAAERRFKIASGELVVAAPKKNLPKVTNDKGKGKAGVIDLCSTDDEVGGEDEEVDELEDDDDEVQVDGGGMGVKVEDSQGDKDWMRKDMAGWRDEIDELDDVSDLEFDVVASKSKGKKRAMQSPSPLAESESDTSTLTGSAPAKPPVARRWRAASSERDEPIPTAVKLKGKRPPQQFFTDDGDAQLVNDAVKKQSKALKRPVPSSSDDDESNYARMLPKDRKAVKDAQEVLRKERERKEKAAARSRADREKKKSAKGPSHVEGSRKKGGKTVGGRNERQKALLADLTDEEGEKAGEVYSDDEVDWGLEKEKKKKEKKGGENAQAGPSGSNKSKDWVCRVCTLLNSSSADKCEVCDASRN